MAHIERSKPRNPIFRLDERELIARDTIELGRLVTDPKIPWADFYDTPAVVLKKFPPLIVVEEGYRSGSDERDHTTAVLQRLFSRSSSKPTRIATRIEAWRSQKYSLMDQSSVFSQICLFESARTFLQKNLSRGNKIYMITGFRTLIDFEIETTLRRTEFAFSKPLPLPDAHRFIYAARGEYVYSVQYALISFKRFANRGKLSRDSHDVFMLPEFLPTVRPTPESDADKVNAQNSHAEAENTEKREEVSLSRKTHVLSFLWMR
jgi:hypothetical protein